MPISWFTINLSINCQESEIDKTIPNFHLIKHGYLCSVVSGELVLNEHEAARWLGSDELYSVDWLTADVDVVKVVERYLM